MLRNISLVSMHGRTRIDRKRVGGGVKILNLDGRKEKKAKGRGKLEQRPQSE